MSSTSSLNSLFKKWQKSYYPYQGKFIADGIINEELYQKQKSIGKAILFIAKEPNDPQQTEWDFRDWLNQSPMKSGFVHRLGEWAYGIQNDFPVFEEAKIRAHFEKALRSSAFINLKKSGGGGSADNNLITKITEETKEFLMEQIQIINPDIIISSIFYTDGWNVLFNNIKWVDSGYDLGVARIGNIKVVDFYHPSNRSPAAMKYCLLEKVIKSTAFKAL